MKADFVLLKVPQFEEQQISVVAVYCKGVPLCLVIIPCELGFSGAARG